MFVRPDEAPLPLVAGSTGMEGLILNFPRVSAHADAARLQPAARSWQCDLCSFAYDEAQGMPEEGIAAGTRWGDIPEDWTCPDCGARKQDFRRSE
jgi:rubredoxin